jgi:hypothetical protein
VHEVVAATNNDAELFGLSVILGQNQAWSLMAGRCTAVQAETLWRIRDQRWYRCSTTTWREFCTESLKISGAEADRAIRLLRTASFGLRYSAVPCDRSGGQRRSPSSLAGAETGRL